MTFGVIFSLKMDTKITRDVSFGDTVATLLECHVLFEWPLKKKNQMLLFGNFNSKHSFTIFFVLLRGSLVLKIDVNIGRKENSFVAVGNNMEGVVQFHDTGIQ